ncbi:integrase, partial [Erythrobacter sp. T5W1-R]|nr:integrase [Erythrobacter sp. T5W1-R]
MQNRVSRNAGRTVDTKRPLTQKQIWVIRFFLDREERLRDRALFDLAIDSKLHGCDLVKLKIGDLVAGCEVRDRAMITQRKTGRLVQFEITADARSS